MQVRKLVAKKILKRSNSPKPLPDELEKRKRITSGWEAFLACKLAMRTHASPP